MEFYLHGMDGTDPEGCARTLRALGFSAVVDGGMTPRKLEALARHGLKGYACVSAFGLLEDIKSACVDDEGRARVWFGSGCPTDPELRERRFQRALAVAELEGLQGVLLDGARFASPASPEGEAAFFTCFCPRCMERAGQMGASPRRMRQAVARARQGGGRPEDWLGELDEWLTFRQRVIDEYIRAFAGALRAARPGLRVGAYIFPDSLAGWVGQRAPAIYGLDLVAPMLYRRFPDPQGPACLNHEHAALARLFPAGERPWQAVLSEGFEPERLGEEVRAAKARCAPGSCLAPILQLDDARLGESVAAVARAGAQAVGFFCHGRAPLPEVGALAALI